MALARIRLSGEPASPPAGPVPDGEWLVARVCSEYLQYCERAVQRNDLSRGHLEGAQWVLNDLCKYCGALPVAQLKRTHIQAWIDSHAGWKSSATRRSVVAIVQAAFNAAATSHEIANPLKGLKRPAARPRLHSLSPEDEAAIYKATDQPFRDFLFAAVHTGLRPFSELARLTADHVEQTDRGMLWRVYAAKTKKVRKIPVRPTARQSPGPTTGRSLKATSPRRCKKRCSSPPNWLAMSIRHSPTKRQNPEPFRGLRHLAGGCEIKEWRIRDSNS